MSAVETKAPGSKSAAGSTPRRSRSGSAPVPHADSQLMQRLLVWEELLALVVDRESPRVRDRASRLLLLDEMLRRTNMQPKEFWGLSPARRSRTFLTQWSRGQRAVPQLEITSFDVDKAAKERFRSEPLTLGAAWHYGFWRSYFSHAAITHPANDGLREEFSTAWDIQRKLPAVLERGPQGTVLAQTPVVHLDMPILVGPLPHSDGTTLERPYLEAIGRADPQRDLHVATRVLVEVATYRDHSEFYAAYRERLVVRVPLEELMPNAATARPGGWDLVREVADTSRLVEIAPGDHATPQVLQDVVAKLHAAHPQLLLSVYLRYGAEFWKLLYAAAESPGVAMLHVHAGAEKSYRLVPRVDALLKAARLRSRVQLVSAGGDTDTLSSAAAVYEAVLLGANGGSVTHLAELALAPDFAANADDATAVMEGLRKRKPEEGGGRGGAAP
jgi:hypothetical protein